MKKVWLPVLISIFMGLVGLIVGSFFDKVFGGANFAFVPYTSIIFVIITMGAFIIDAIVSKK